MELYLNQMLETGIITKPEYKKLCEYTGLTDVIITYKNGVFKSSTPQDTLYFSNIDKLMRYVKTDLYYIYDALAAMYEDREADGKQSDFDDKQGVIE